MGARWMQGGGLMNKMMRRLSRNRLVVVLAAGSLVAAGAGIAEAKGGTAKPPKGAVSPWVIPTLPDPQFSVAPAQLHGFDDTGFITDATVSNALCPAFTDPSTYGGTVTLNGVEITIPCNLIVQMPANTLTWADFVAGSSVPGSIPLNGLELRAAGNIVGTKHIAGLAFASQQSTNTANGFITSFDYANGSMNVANAKGGTVTVQINDPKIDGLLPGGGAPGRLSLGSASTRTTRPSTQAPATRCASRAPIQRWLTIPCAHSGTGPISSR
jgi:hypothetical protein